MKENEIMDMFGLTMEQSYIMFSTQKLIAEYDYNVSREKDESTEILFAKANWIDKWEESIMAYLDSGKRKYRKLAEEEELSRLYKLEVKKNSNNKTWYYIVLLECLAFSPYTALEVEEDEVSYKKCKYNEKVCVEKIKSFFTDMGDVSPEAIERLGKTYDKSLNDISGKNSKLLTKTLAVLAAASAVAALAAVFAGPIAVALFGKTFAELSGAALTSACLAMAGGGAVAVGGNGIAGGIMVIAGGGALLGGAGAGTVVGATSVLMASVPEYTLTQAAKLETILKEVILFAQKDVLMAQNVLEQYSRKVEELHAEIGRMELEDKKNKKEIQNLKLSLEYIKKSYGNMQTAILGEQAG